MGSFGGGVRGGYELPVVANSSLVEGQKMLLATKPSRCPQAVQIGKEMSDIQRKNHGEHFSAMPWYLYSL